MATRALHFRDHVVDVVFDREAIVRAALRAYVEVTLARVDPLRRLTSPVCCYPGWAGNLTRGAFYNSDGCGNEDVVAWTEVGVVGLAFEMGFGPIEQLGLSVDAVTGGPEDVRGAVPEMPVELEPAFLLAANMLGESGGPHGEKLAGVGFWLRGDRTGGSIFNDSRAMGAPRLAAWGWIRNGRLPRLCSPEDAADFDQVDRTIAAPIQAIVDAVVERALTGPTQLAPDEIAAILPSPARPSSLLGAQRRLHQVGVTWPGLPPVPEKRPRSGPNPNSPRSKQVRRTHPVHRCVSSFDRDILVRAALHAYVESLLAKLDPQRRHPFPVCDEPDWTGDLTCGAFYNGASNGDYDVVAWTETGVIGLTYTAGFGPIEQLSLSIDAVTGGPNDVRGALPDIPAALEPALVLATGMLRTGPHGEKLASVGFWLHDKTVAGSFFDMPEAPGVARLVRWGELDVGTLRQVPDPNNAAIEGNFALWTNVAILTIVDAVVERALLGPTELTLDEITTLLPTPAEPAKLAFTKGMLRKVGIGWPGAA